MKLLSQGLSRFLNLSFSKIKVPRASPSSCRGSWSCGNVFIDAYYFYIDACAGTLGLVDRVGIAKEGRGQGLKEDDVVGILQRLVGCAAEQLKRKHVDNLRLPVSGHRPAKKVVSDPENLRHDKKVLAEAEP